VFVLGTNHVYVYTNPYLHAYFYTLDLKSKEYEFIANTVSPVHKRIKLSQLKITKSLKSEFKGNHISFVVDKTVDTDTIDKIINKLILLKPLSIRTEFTALEQYSIDSTHSFDGVDIPSSISEFIEMLDNINYKSEVLNHTLELYNRFSK